MRTSLIALGLAAATALAAPALAQQASITQSIAGTRLDVNATGEVTRVPDIAVINAGVTTRRESSSAVYPKRRRSSRGR